MITLWRTTPTTPTCRRSNSCLSRIRSWSGESWRITKSTCKYKLSPLRVCCLISGLTSISFFPLNFPSPFYFRRCQSPAEADMNLLETARRCELYGTKMHAAKVINTSVEYFKALKLQYSAGFKILRMYDRGKT